MKEESRIIKLEQEKLSKFCDLEITMSGGNSDDMKKGMPSLIGVCFPQKGNAELIKTLEKQGWYFERKDKRDSEFWVHMSKDIIYEKYAIYQTSYGGLHAKEYIDNVYELKRKRLFYIKPEYLPVTVNSTGFGYTSFEEKFEKNNGFIEIIKVLEGEEPLTREQRFPKNAQNFLYGWIDRAGNTYSCGFTGHTSCADAICRELKNPTFDPEKTLDSLGWVKMSRDVPYTPENYGKARPYYSVFAKEENPYISKRQYETLCRLGFEDDPYVRMWNREIF